MQSIVIQNISVTKSMSHLFFCHNGTPWFMVLERPFVRATPMLVNMPPMALTLPPHKDARKRFWIYFMF